MFLPLLVLGVALLAYAGASMAGAHATKGSGLARLDPQPRQLVLAYVATKIATLQGAPTQGVPSEPGGRTVILVDPPREYGWDTMPASDWIQLATQQGNWVLISGELLAAVTPAEVAYWAKPGGHWAVLSEPTTRTA